MAVRQLRTPNFNVAAFRGWCLGYVDDSVNAPNRQLNAQAALNVERRNGNVRTGEPPVGVWVPIFFSLGAGQFKGLGHVAWAFNHGNGWIEVRDSETRTGARAIYRNIAEVLAWFSRHSITYQGWSTWIDGVRVVEEYTPVVAVPNTGRMAAKGTARVTVAALNVRNAPDDQAAIQAVYNKGQTFTYDSYQIADGYVWLSYVSFSGVRRYIAEGPANGVTSDVYVSGGVS